MAFTDELEALLAAHVPLIQIVTYEEDRVAQMLLGMRLVRQLGISLWDQADNFSTLRAGAKALPAEDCTSDTLLKFLATKAPEGHIFLLRDFHHAWTGKRGYVTRKLRNMAPALRVKNQCLIFTTPEPGLPVELRNDVLVMHLPLPGVEELQPLFEEVTEQLDRRVLPPHATKEKLLASALGLTSTQARYAFSRVYAQFQRFDERGIELITWAKRDVIRESGALEFWAAGEGLADVGGLDLLKGWLQKREKGFTTEARKALLPFPRGVVLIGIPGTGKSLTAKMLSGVWKLPLLRLDVGAVFGSLVGESEEQMRKAIALADLVSPCILWIDELEKAFAGTAVGVLNNGVATRVFGAFLTWMQEHRTPVFVVATANDVNGLAPELLARFDRIFFLDLPNTSERREIFLIHLKRAGVVFPERQFNLDTLVRESHGYVGREIERAVREAQFTAFADDNREVTMDDLVTALQETVPLLKSHAEVVEELRRWKTEGRAYPASTEEEERLSREINTTAVVQETQSHRDTEELVKG